MHTSSPSGTANSNWECFPNYLPTLPARQPNICMNIHQYGKENLDSLSIEMHSEYIYDKAFLPALVDSTFNEPVEEEEEQTEC